jgi:hypothetical protein
VRVVSVRVGRLQRTTSRIQRAHPHAHLTHLTKTHVSCLLAQVDYSGLQIGIMKRAEEVIEPSSPVIEPEEPEEPEPEVRA